MHAFTTSITSSSTIGSFSKRFVNNEPSSSTQCCMQPSHVLRSAPTLRNAPCRSNVAVASHNKHAELQLGWPGADSFYEASDIAPAHTQYDVLGLGQAMIDFQAATDTDDYFETIQVEKGTRKIISAEERTAVLNSLDGESYRIEAGGSLSNTLMCLASLSSAATTVNETHKPLKVAMAGLIGADALGSYYSAQMRASGVEVISPPTEGALTGTVAVITSPDAQRTMLSYLGTPLPVRLNPTLEAAIASSKVLVIEGYLWEIEEAADTITAAITVAKQNGTLVAMTAGDAGVVHRHHSELWAAIVRGIDLLFTNAAEAEALASYLPADVAIDAAAAVPTGTMTAAERAAVSLGPYCSLVAVTDGANGSVITALGQKHVIPPHWTESRPVDTCGAGDAYAAGLLYGFLQKFDVTSMGRTGARVASNVIAHHGARLEVSQAVKLAGRLPSAALSASAWQASVTAASERAV